MTVDPPRCEHRYHRTLRRNRIGWIVVGLVVGAAFFVPQPELEPPLDGLVNLAHVPVFAVFGYLLARWLPAGPTLARVGAAFAIIFVCGVATEMLQPYFGRGASFADLGADIGSGLAGFAAAGAVAASSGPRRVFAALVALVAITAGSLAALGMSLSELAEKFAS